MFGGLRPQLLVVAALSGSLFVGCGSSSGGGGGSSSPPVLTGIEVRPNSTTLAIGDSGKQFSAEAKDAAGNTINGEEIFWEIVNNDGRKGSVNATGWYRPPTVLPDASNVVMVKAFSRDNPEKNGFASVSLLTGGQLSFGGNARVAPHTTGDDDYAFGGQNVAVLDQTVYTVWADNSNNDYDIYIAKSLDRGRTFSCQSRLQLANDQLSPSIVVDGQGHVYIAAFDNSLGSNYGIFFVKGQPNSSGCIDFVQQGVVFSSPTEAYYSPSIAIGPDGNVYMAWNWGDGASSGIYFAKGTPANQTQEIIFGSSVLAKTESTSAVFYDEPGISVTADGKIYIVYSRTDSQGSQILLARSGDGGTNFQEVSVNDQTYSIYPVLAVGQDGTIYIAWTDFRSAQPKIYLARSTNGGQSFPDRFDGIANLQGEQWLPALSVDQAGGIYLAWENVDLAANKDIYFAKSMDGGMTFYVHPPVNDDGAGQAQYSPSLALDSAGRAFILWFDERNTCLSSCPYALYLAMGQ